MSEKGDIRSEGRVGLGMWKQNLSGKCICFWLAEPNPGPPSLNAIGLANIMQYNATELFVISARDRRYLLSCLARLPRPLRTPRLATARNACAMGIYNK